MQAKRKEDAFTTKVQSTQEQGTGMKTIWYQKETNDVSLHWTPCVCVRVCVVCVVSKTNRR